jgi:hypothetical protein
LRDYFEEMAFLGEVLTSTDTVSLSVPKALPHSVEVQGMENGAEWRKRVNLSYARLSRKNCCTSTFALTGEEPLTNGLDGREDCSVAAAFLLPHHPNVWAGRRPDEIGLFTDG